jgi:hypothetical protein
VTRSIRACGATPLQHLINILSHVRNVVDLDIHSGTTIALAAAQFCTRVDLRILAMLSRGTLSVVFENLIQGYDEATCEVAGTMSAKDLILWAP